MFCFLKVKSTTILSLRTVNKDGPRLIDPAHFLATPKRGGACVKPCKVMLNKL